MDKSVKAKLIELNELTDQDWYFELAKNDAYAKTLTKLELTDLIKNSILCAKDVCEQMLTEYGKLKPLEYLDRYLINVVYSHVDGFKLYIAMYNDRHKEIDVNLTAINKIDNAIEKFDCKDIVEEEKVLDVALMHELYHYFEMNLDNIYTNLKIVPKKFLFVKYNMVSALASEIGAIHFSKLATNLKHSPKLYEKIITLKGCEENENDI